jgi:hypothetical protein
MTIKRELLRAWVYEGLADARKLTSNPNLQLSDISRWVKQKAQQDGLLPADTLVATNNLDNADEDAIRELIWALTIQGIVVPGSSNDSSYQANLPWVQVTEWGKLCLKEGEYLPCDTGLFLNRLRGRIPGLDRTVELYITEALNSFRPGNYLAAAVMTGVASERVLIILRDAVYAAIQQEDRKKIFLRDTESRLAKRIYEEIEKKLDPIREQLPTELQDSLGTELTGIFQLVRRTRNDAGHPTGVRIEREEAYALLQLFPTYASSVYELVSWLKTNPI